MKQNFFQADARYTTSKAKTTIPAGYALVRVGPQYQRNFLHEFIWGQHYRDVWSEPVPVKILDLTQVYGGLTPTELGGGLQSTSLGLQDKNGRPYTLRTLDKDPSKALPPSLRKTFVANIMRDQTSAINPFAAFTLPPLAEAAAIFHTNPQVYYVPADAQGLGEHLPKFAGKVVMLEEKFNKKEALTPAFSNAIDFVDTETLFKNRFAKNTNLADQLAYARARLFDVLIKDWDRHDGQWNWAVYPDKTTGETIYKAVPKDRDQTYYRYTDGLLPWLTTRRLLVGRIKPLIHNIPDVGGLIYNSRFLDERLLNELTREDWHQIATEMQTAFTEEVIQKSLALFPEPVKQLEGENTYNLLKKRISQLPRFAEDFYLILAKRVTIAGSDQAEQFVVNRQDDKHTVVQVFAAAKTPNQTQRKLYQRTINHDHTKEIVLHGLGGDDEFTITGNASKGLKIYVYGDAGQDKITDSSQVKGSRRKTIALDTKTGTTLSPGPETEDRTSDKTKLPEYERLPE